VKLLLEFGKTMSKKGNTMSRIGKQPITLPEEVKIEIKNNQSIIKGPKGSITRDLRPEIEVKIQDQQILVSIDPNQKKAKAFQGLFRTLIANDIKGVTEGWGKTLEMAGVGYRAKMDEENVILEVGFSQPVVMKTEEGIDFKVEGKTKITVSGIRKDQVGEVAARIRAIRPPEPYKGKGIHYLGEVIRRKEGKKAGVAGA